jgi:hypothetical protein
VWFWLCISRSTRLCYLAIPNPIGARKLFYLVAFSDFGECVVQVIVEKASMGWVGVLSQDLFFLAEDRVASDFH